MRHQILALTAMLVIAACGNDSTTAPETTDKNTGKGDCANCNTELAPPREQPDFCDEASIQTAALNLVPDDPNAGKFAYHFRYFPPTDPSKPTVVYMPGGPGVGSLSKTRESFTEVPEEYGVLLTEARGSGCNDFDIPSYLELNQIFTTENVATDILRTLSELNITNYVLYGHSYGTVVATVAAHFAPTTHVPPIAVVLEGTVGKSFEAQEYIDGYQRVWTFLNQFLSNEAVVALSEDDTDKLGFTNHQWGQSIQTWLVYDPILLIDILNAAFDPSTSDDAEQQREASKESIAFLAGTDAELLPNEGTTGPYGSSLFRSIACSQLWEFNADFRLTAGALEPELIVCDSDSLADVYDSAKYPITGAPILYLQGRLDPATTIGSANYHFENQSQTTRHFFQFNNAAHLILGSITVPVAKPCNAEIWAAATGTIAPARAAEKCGELGQEQFEFRQLETN